MRGGSARFIRRHYKPIRLPEHPFRLVQAAKELEDLVGLIREVGFGLFGCFFDTNSPGIISGTGNDLKLAILRAKLDVAESGTSVI